MSIDNMVNPKSITGVKSFYKIFQQLNWIDDNIIGQEIKQFLSENELIDYIIKNGKFGIVEELSAICWSGEGYYISWNWNGKHIDRIDMANFSLIKEYDKRLQECPSVEITDEETNDFLTLNNL